MSMHHLISRLIDKPEAVHEAWFNFNGVEVRFCHLDYALISGLKFGSTSFNPDEEYPLAEVQVYQSFCRPQALSNLVANFANPRYQVPDEDGSLYLQAANVILLYSVLFVYDDNKKIASWVWKLVSDLDAFNVFPWGAYTYKIHLYYIDKINKNVQYRFFGPVWVFYMWGLEVIPMLGQSVAYHDDRPIYPRCLRWTPHQKQLIPLEDIFGQSVTIKTLEPDHVEQMSDYWLSTQLGNPLGVHFTKPRNKIREGEPFERVRREPSPPLEHNITEQAANRHETLRKRDTTKRPRTQTPSSSSSGGEPHRGIQTVRLDKKQEERIVEKTAKKVIHEVKKLIDGAINVFRCSSSRRAPAYEPRRRHNQPTQPRCSVFEESDDEPHQNEDAHNRGDDDNHDDDDVYVENDDCDFGHHNYTPHVPPRTFIPQYYTPHMPSASPFVLPRRSMPEFNYNQSGFTGFTWDYTLFGTPSIKDLVEPSRHSVHTFGEYTPLPLSVEFPLEERLHEQPHEEEAKEEEPQIEVVAPRRSKRGKQPAPVVQSPFVIEVAPKQLDGYDTLAARYEKFKKHGNNFVSINGINFSLPFFQQIEDHNATLESNAFDLYVKVLQQRVAAQNNVLRDVTSKHTVILHTDFFRKVEFEASNIAKKASESSTAARITSTIDVGEDISKWLDAQFLIVPILLGRHFFVLHIHMSNWIATVYDSLWHVEGIQDIRREQLKPLVENFWLVLDSADYFTRTRIICPPRNSPLELIFGSKKHSHRFYRQLDNVSCGPFALMMIEKLISGAPSVAWGQKNVALYRQRIAISIYGLYRSPTRFV